MYLNEKNNADDCAFAVERTTTQNAGATTGNTCRIGHAPPNCFSRPLKVHRNPKATDTNGNSQSEQALITIKAALHHTVNRC